MDSPSFTLTVSTGPPEVRVSASGQLDLCAAAPLNEALGEAVATGCRQFCVDLGDVTFIDASCLDVFASLARRLRAENGCLLFVAVSARVHRSFSVAGMGGMLRLTLT